MRGRPAWPDVRRRGRGIDVRHAGDFLVFGGWAVAGPALREFLDGVDGRAPPALRRDNGGTLPQTSDEGEAVLGLWVGDRLMPLSVDDDGAVWFSQIQLANVSRRERSVIFRSAARIGAVAGTPGVAMRKAPSVDGDLRQQLHYDMARAMAIAVEIGSAPLAAALMRLSSFMGGSSGSGQAWTGAGRAQALKALPPTMRAISVE